MPPITALHDSPLGRWNHTVWSPTRLAGVVDRIWHFEGRTAHRHERAFPSGQAELVVQVDGVYREARGSAPFDRVPPICLSGLQTGPTVIESPARPSVILGIRLTAAGTFRLLGYPIQELANETVALEDLIGTDGRRLGELVAAGTNARDRVTRAAEWVLDRIARNAVLDPGVAWVAGQIEDTSGAVRVGALRASTGFGKQRLATLFREQIGLSPKTYARILRFRRALTMINEGGTSLATIADRSGYYDQPHMNGEFRELGGMTPTDFLAATKYQDSVNLAE